MTAERRWTTSAGSVRLLAGLVVAWAWAGPWPSPAAAQNDWQFPDPYFGAKVAHAGPPTVADERRYRREISAPPSGSTRPRPAHPTREHRRGRLRRR